jgi:glycosyltransferase involved in cell wall biosynthesis
VRLLAYTDATGIGGAEISLANLLHELADDRGLHITVLGRTTSVVRRVAPAGVASVVAPLHRHPAVLARLRPDLVHVNLPTPWAASPVLAAALALPRARVLAVQQLPLRTVELPLWLRTRALLRRLDAHVAVGTASCRRTEDFYALGRGSVRSIPNCVPDVPADLRRCAPVPNGAEVAGADPAGADLNPVVIGSLGRLDRMKGYDLLLDALARVPGARVEVLGEGTERASLEAQARRLGVAARVRFPGWEPDPRRRLPEWDVFCLPSRSEGFPLSVVEAMLAGLPVVASDVGSVGEAVQPDATGLLVAKDDIDGLVRALTAVVGSASERGRLGAAGRARAAEHFTVDHMARAYRALYDEMLDVPRRSRRRPGPDKP